MTHLSSAGDAFAMHGNLLITLNEYGAYMKATIAPAWCLSTGREKFQGLSGYPDKQGMASDELHSVNNAHRSIS